MLTKLPIIAPAVGFSGLLRAAGRLCDKSVEPALCSALSDMTGLPHIELTSSGIAAFYMILKYLAMRSSRRQVVLPAYTAGSLVVAVQKAGLKTVLCDVSMDDLNMDDKLLPGVISKDTLAVVAVHMFGVPMKNIASIKQAIPEDVVLIEDCAQSLGSTALGKPLGNFGDIAFFSFNRGKNLPFGSGGCIAGRIGQKYGTQAAPQGVLSPASAFAKMAAYCIASNRYVYGIGYPLISLFKETKPPDDVDVKDMGCFTMAVGYEAVRSAERIFDARAHNGKVMADALAGTGGVRVPSVGHGMKAAFNRFPVVFDDADRRSRAIERLSGAGIETSIMYGKPLHHMFDLGYDKAQFPNSAYIADRLLTLPAHPYVTGDDLKSMIRCIKDDTR